MVDTESVPTGMRLLNEIFRPTERCPLIRAGPHQAGLRRDQHSVVRVNRLADQLLRDVWAVGVGSVDEVDADIGQTPQHAKHLVAIGRVTPDSASHDAHGAEAESVDRDVAADLERAGQSRVWLGIATGHPS